MYHHSLLQIVQRTRRLWNRRAAIELAGWLITAALLSLLIAGVFDYWFRLSDPGIRFLLSTALLIFLLVLAWGLMRRWRLSRWSDFQAASKIQDSFPHLGDRVASALEFLSQDEAEGPAGSLALRRAVVLDATASVEELPVAESARSIHLNKALSISVVLLLLGTALALWNPSSVKTALVRLALPWSDVEWPRYNSLEFINPPSIIARGEPFEVALVDLHGQLPEEVQIEYRYRLDGRRQTDTEVMQRVGDKMVARRNKVMREFEFRAIGGDHRSMPWKSVSVVDPPNLNSIELVAHPPEYSGLPPARLNGPARVLAGSSLSLEANSSVPLRGARLESPLSEPVPLELVTPSRVVLAPGRWVATLEQGRERLAEFQISLNGINGLVGLATPQRLRIVDDPAPQVAWGEPSQDLYVLATAVIPITVRAADNLAISAAELGISVQPVGRVSEVGEQEENSGSATPNEPIERVLPLFSLESPPQLDALPATGTLLDEREFRIDLSLGDYGVSAGSILSLEARATDFRPQSGRTSNLRRITIISMADLESRLAAQQTEILRRLEQALQDQRASRQDSLDAVGMSPADLAAERARLSQFGRARSGQQKVRNQLVAPRDGVLDLLTALRQEIVVNQLQRPELWSQLETIRDAITRLEKTPLPEAEQSLTDMRKQLEGLVGKNPPTKPSLVPASERLELAQQDIITTLEQLIEQLAAWSDAERFVRELATLESMERELAANTAAAAVRQAQARARQEELPQEDINRMAAQQTELTRRAEKLFEAMRQMTGASSLQSDFAKRLSDAVNQADQQQLTRQMAAAARDAERRQLGRAAESQQRAADTLAELLGLLRDTAPTDPGELAAELRKLQQQLADLRQELEESAAKSDESRQALADKMGQLARQLNRMTAAAASQSMQQASANAVPKEGASAEQKQQQVDQAQQQANRAQRELAERIAELEQQQQQRLLERLAIVLQELIPQQQEVIAATLRLQDAEQGETGGPEERQYKTIADDQTRIADQLSNAIADLAARAVFQLSLRGAEGDMRQASNSLDRKDAGHLTQQLELAALARLRHVLDILEEPPPAPEEPQENEGGEGSPGEQGPKRPPLIELAEAKMLRWLQVELNGRTRLYESDLADNSQAKADKREVSDRLAEEQSQLEALVREMMQRRTSPDEPQKNL
jgi:hypothetical protein